MTNRVKGLVVTLSEDVRDDDVQVLIDAIALLRGVVDVAPVGVDLDDHINRTRIRRELEAKLYAALREDK